MKIQDSEHVHLTFEKCTNVNATNLSITALEKSLNINGFHVTNIQHVHIFNSTIGTDTLLLLLLLQPYLIKHKPSSFSIECYVVPFLLILSLILLLLCNQIKLIEAHVFNIIVNGANISGSSNGVKIKTYHGGSRSASNITFLNINRDNVMNPIIIDQNYYDRKRVEQR
ncbi:hypothetical protein M9H77_22764 [Catharanthus roseus]|uniref:Uncharacterized protein n=1 Tax=Catharanthus roseus TaxID=4058 RepID=A0ACC0AS40_CATRO|nr:hypothetical protein M9H77_22764 [Catharanthus roseus]